MARKPHHGAITVTCGECGWSFQLPSVEAMRQARCDSCGGNILKTNIAKTPKPQHKPPQTF